MPFLIFAIIGILGFSAHADAINWSLYYPSSSSTTQIYRNAQGAPYSYYSYLRFNQDSNTGFPLIYNSYLTVGTNVANIGKNIGNIGSKGFLGVWVKMYAGQAEPATYAHLWFGNDNRVTEVGDYLNVGPGSYSIFGYSDTTGSVRSGLQWSPQYSGTAVQSLALPYYPQTSRPSGSLSAYSNVWAETLPSFTPLYGAKNGVWGRGNAKTYYNVQHVLFYHGPTATRNVDCSKVPGTAYKPYYAHVPGYNTYLSEYYLAQGKWIIQERTVYIEDASYWRSRGQQVNDCSGPAFDAVYDDSYGANYIDDRN